MKMEILERKGIELELGAPSLELFLVEFFQKDNSCYKMAVHEAKSLIERCYPFLTL